MDKNIKYLYRALRKEEIEAGNILIPKEQETFKKLPRLGIDTRLPFVMGETEEHAVRQHQWQQKGFLTSGISTTPHFERAKYYKEKFGLELPSRIQFSGPPGSGKTFEAKQVALKAEAWFYDTYASDFGGSYMNDGVNFSNALFEHANTCATPKHPAVIVINEVDAIARSRNSLGNGSASADKYHYYLTETHGKIRQKKYNQ